MRTAPPTVPGMLTPNSIPVSPACAARAETAGRRAPPPQRICVPSSSIVLSSLSSFRTSPRTPPSATSRFDPDPTTPTSNRSAAGPREQPLELAERSRAREQLGRAAGADRRQPGQRVVALDPGGQRRPWPRSVDSGPASTRLRRPATARQRVDVAGAHRQAQVARRAASPSRNGGRRRTTASRRPAARRRRRPWPRRSACPSTPGKSSARSRAG